MTSWNWRGKPVTDLSELVTHGYATSLKNQDFDAAEVEAEINSQLSAYATDDYVDSRDLLNATQAFIDAGDATRLRLNERDAPNGVLALDGTGKVNPARFNVASAQSYAKGPWTPNAYQPAPVQITTETVVYQCNVTDPGYPYKLIVFGLMDAVSTLDNEHPIFIVREGNSVSGQVIARGRGMENAPQAVVPTLGDYFDTPVSGLGSGWNQTNLIGPDGRYSVSDGTANWREAAFGGESLWRYRKLGSDALTLTDFQRIRLNMATQFDTASGPYLMLCGRLNVEETDWIGCQIFYSATKMCYSLNGNIVFPTNGVNGFTLAPSSGSMSVGTSGYFDMVVGTAGSLRQVLYYHNNSLIGGMVDANGITAADANHRGWGFRAFADNTPFAGQYHPGEIDSLLISDAPPARSSVTITPTDLSTMTVRTGPTTLYVCGVRSGAASTIDLSASRPKLHVQAVKA